MNDVTNQIMVKLVERIREEIRADLFQIQLEGQIKFETLEQTDPTELILVVTEWMDDEVIGRHPEIKLKVVEVRRTNDHK